MAKSCGGAELFNSWQPGSRERKWNKGSGIDSKVCLSDLLPLTGPYLLNISTPLEIAPPSGGQA
jgi:hypothetical protein